MLLGGSMDAETHLATKALGLGLENHILGALPNTSDQHTDHRLPVHSTHFP